MRTTIKKRIGPVPITLVAVFALAALLSAGLLLAPNGAPTAEAQATDCTPEELTVGANGVPTPGTVACVVHGDTATIVFEGPAGAYNTGIDGKISLLIQDDSGPIRAYPNNTQANALTAVPPTATAMRYRYQLITVPAGVANPTTGIIESQKVTVMVKGTVYAWTGTVSVTSPISGTEDTAAAGAREVANNPASTIASTFFGAPAIGKDAQDYNKIVDDVPDDDCVKSADNTGSGADRIALPTDENCPTGYTRSTETNNPNESRSTVRVDGDAITFTAADKSVLDGGKAEITLTGTQSTATIQATIKDKKATNNILTGVEVTFAASSDPADIENRTRSYDSDDTDGTADHVIQGLPTDKPYRVTVVVTADGLDVPIGTIVIARAGDLDTVTAEACAMIASDATDTKDDGCMKGYDPKMIYGPEDTFSIYAMATDVRDIKAVTASFMVKPATAATWWDTLNCMEMNDAVMPMDDEPAVGADDMTSPYCKMYADLSNEAKPVVMRAFENAYGDATKAFNITAAGTNVPPSGDDEGMVALTVKDNAPGAKYLLDVVATARNLKDNTKIITKMDQVRVIVSGKVHEYKVDPMETYAQARRSVDFTVSALDKNGNPPIFETGKNMVRVVADYGIVRGAEYNRSTEMLTLKESTGMGAFTFVMPRNAEDDEEFVITIGTGDMQIEAMLTVGTKPDPMMAPGMPMNVMAMADGHDTINVSWDAPASDGNSAITGYMVQSAYMMSDGMMSEWMDADPAHTGMDMMYMDTGLMAETKYYYRVAAMNATGMGDYSDGMAYDMTGMEPAPELKAPTGIDVTPLLNTISVLWDPNSAQNATLIKVVLFDEDVTEIVAIKSYNPASSDPGAHDFEDVEPGTYNVAVAAYRSGEDHVLSDFHPVTIE